MVIYVFFGLSFMFISIVVSRLVGQKDWAQAAINFCLLLVSLATFIVVTR